MKKIAFLAPTTKGWPYFIYKELVESLNKKYWNKIEAHFFHTKKDRLKLHFNKYDTIFSVIPFLFKPVWAGKYIFNPRGNFELEKKINRIWNKLLYFARSNLKFADKIWLVSYFLADKLNFKNKYNDKIIIIPNFIDSEKYNFGKKIYDETRYKILTITSFKFYEKGRGVLNLWKVIQWLWQKTTKPIERTIAWNSDNENFKKIKSEFDKIKFTKNIKITRKWRLSKSELKKQLQNNDYFLYWTYLDNFPWVILEAIASKMKILVNNFESFKYFLDKEIICEDEDEMIQKTSKKNTHKKKIWPFDKSKVLDNIYKLIKQNENKKNSVYKQ